MRRRGSVRYSEGVRDAQRLETDFELERTLGSGEFGTVGLYRHRLGRSGLALCLCVFVCLCLNVRHLVFVCVRLCETDVFSDLTSRRHPVCDQEIKRANSRPQS